MPNKEEILKIRISEALKEQAKEVAQEKGESLAVIVREALRQYIEENSVTEKSKHKDQEK